MESTDGQSGVLLLLHHSPSTSSVNQVPLKIPVSCHTKMLKKALEINPKCIKHKRMQAGVSDYVSRTSLFGFVCPSLPKQHSWKPTLNVSLVTKSCVLIPRLKPKAAGWEAQTLPLFFLPSHKSRLLGIQESTDIDCQVKKPVNQDFGSP